MTNVHGTKRLITLFIMLFAFALGAAEYGMRFPQQKDYDGRLKKPGDQKLLTKAVLKQYKTYKEKCLREAENTPGGYYILSTATDGSKHIITVSEAHGWGMTIMAYMAGADTTADGTDMAKVYFDGMVDFWNDHQSGYLMNWRIFDGEWSQGADGAATDGDLDIANAFVLAHKQWGDSQYLTYAKNIINAIKNHEMNSSSYLPMIGNFGVAPAASRPSDWLGNNFRNFKAVSNDGFWDNAADAIYSNYNTFVQTNSSETGLISDFVDDGKICGEWFLNEFQYTNSFNTNACRVPFRFAYDYFLWDSREAKLGLYKMCTWASKATEGKAINLKSGYWVDDGSVIKEGSDLGVDDFDFNSMYFLGSFLAGMTALPTQTAFAQDLFSECAKDYSIDNADAFGHAIYLQALLLISGNAWDYYDTCTYVAPEPIDTGGVIFDHFNNIYYDDNEQTALGAAFGASKLGQVKSHFGGCYWFAYKDEFGSSIKNVGGTVIDSTNFNEAVVNDSANEQNYLHLLLKNEKIDQEKNQYPFTGFGAYFRQDIDENDTTKFHTKYVDISNTKHFVVKAKGKGTVKVMMITKAFDELADSSQWGHFHVPLELTDQLEEHAFELGEFQSDPYNEDAKAIKWSDAQKEVKAIHFEYGGDNTELEIWIDEIRFTGLTYENDFGFTWVEPVEEAIVQKGTVTLHEFSAALNAKKEIQLTLPVKSGLAEVKLYNVQGKVVRSLPLQVENFATSLNATGLAGGVYFMNITVDGFSQTARIKL